MYKYHNLHGAEAHTLKSLIMSLWWNVWCTAFLITLCEVRQVDAKFIYYKDCGYKTSLKKIDVSPCTEEPCQFKHNTSAQITAWFDSVEDSKQLVVKVYGIVAGVKIPFPIPNPNGCLNCGIKCPVSASKSYVYHNTMKVLPSYPSLKIVNEWKMYGDGDKEMFCFAFPLIIEPNM